MNSGQELCLLANNSDTTYATFRAGAIVANGTCYAVSGFAIASTYTSITNNHFITSYWDVHYT